jgi:hypothetical protein
MSDRARLTRAAVRARKTRLRAPPKHSQTATPPIPLEAAATTQDRRFYPVPAPDASKLEFARVVTSNRRHFTQVVEGNARAEDLAESVRRRIQEFRAMLDPPNLGQIRDLLREKHAWRQEIARFSAEYPRVCADPQCSARPIDGSDYCIAHILMDGRQQFFEQCPRCGRLFPRSGSCFFCPEDATDLSV